MQNDFENPKVLAEITFRDGWNLTPAGTANPFRYWSHVHFEKDSNWGKELWTLFIELERTPEPSRRVHLAKVFFMAPEAPHHLLRAGHKFALCVGPLVKAHGIIKKEFGSNQ